MRRTFPATVGVIGLVLVLSAQGARSFAQSRPDQDDQRRQAESEEDAKKKQKDKEWKLTQAPLPDLKNAGPCPFAKVLYDASRYVELKDGVETASAVGYSGEIQSVQATCAYKKGEPIRVNMAVNMAFGRGPQAAGASKDFHYWVAVTVRNVTVLGEEHFDVAAVFPPGSDRVAYVDRIQGIVIPRAREGVSGSNFEILVGFDVTPKMAEFNRLGKRFRVNAGAPELAEAASAGGPGAR